MKFTLIVDGTTAHADTLKEAATVLFALASASARAQAPAKVKAKKNNPWMRCPECQRSFRGLKAQSIHRSLAHGVRSKLYMKLHPLAQ